MIVSRLSIRARLAVAFAAALVLVLALMALFVYLRVGAVLNSTIDDGLASRATDVTALVTGAEGGAPKLSSGRLAGNDEGFSQVLDSGGAVVASTLEPQAGSVLTSAEARQAAGGQISPGRAKGARGRWPGAHTRPPRRVGAPSRGGLVVGATIEDRGETLAGLAGAFLIGAPIALALSCALGYLLAGRALTTGGADAEPGGGDHPGSQRGAPAPPPRRRRDPPARGHPQRDARPDRGLARPRARLRCGREPRAAHSAGDPAHRAGARRPPGPIPAGAARLRCAPRARRPTGSRSWRRTCS